MLQVDICLAGIAADRRLLEKGSIPFQIITFGDRLAYKCGWKIRDPL